MKKAYIVVGTGNRSIGSAICEELTQEPNAFGSTIVSIDRDSVPPSGTDVMAGLITSDMHYRCDLRSQFAISDTVSAIAHKLAREEMQLAGFIFAAGTNHIAPLGEFPSDKFDDVMNLNVKAPWLFVKELLNQQLIGSGQRVTGVFIGSNTAFVARTRSSAYAASKAALAGMIRSLHRELAPKGVSLMTLDPGPVFGTAMDEETRIKLDLEPADYHGLILKNVPGQVAMYPADVAKQAIHLMLNGRLFGGTNLRLDHGQQQG